MITSISLARLFDPLLLYTISSSKAVFIPAVLAAAFVSHCSRIIPEIGFFQLGMLVAHRQSLDLQVSSIV